MKRLQSSKFEYEGTVYEVKAIVDDEDAALPSWDDSSELTHVGTGAPRIDGLRRVAGGADFTVDVQLPRMLRAAVLRSPHAHASVRALDLAAARRSPGVRAVVGPDDAFGTGPSPL